MASSIESGHAMNVANFGTMITVIVEYGNAYNPARPELKVAALKTTLSNAQAALQKAKDDKAEYDNAVIARDAVFKPLKKFATKIMAAVKACDVSKSVLENLKTVNGKIQGKRTSAVKITTITTGIEGTTEQRKSSTSQQSVDRMIDHFEGLAAILSREPKYIPNEENMSVAGIKALIADMRAKNDAVTAAAAKLQNARIGRDAAIYSPGVGVVALAAGIKNYTKSVYGGQSPQFGRLNKLQFTAKPI